VNRKNELGKIPKHGIIMWTWQFGKVVLTNELVKIPKHLIFHIGRKVKPKAQVRKYVYVKTFHPLEEPLKNVHKL
jgi:hypothetical protein